MTAAQKEKSVDVKNKQGPKQIGFVFFRVLWRTDF